VVNRTIIITSVADHGASYVDGGSFNTTTETFEVEDSYVDGGSFNTTVETFEMSASYVTGGSFNTTTNTLSLNISLVDSGSFNTTVLVTYEAGSPGDMYCNFNFTLISIENVTFSRPTYTVTKYTIWFNSTSYSELYCKSDLNEDGIVDDDDVDILTLLYGATGTSGWIKADIVKDGKIDIFDVSAMMTDYGIEQGPEDAVGISFFNWKINDFNYQGRNLSYTFTINWEETTETHFNYPIYHSVENETTGKRNSIIKTLTINYFEEPEDKYFDFPTELFIIFMAIIIVVVLTYTVINIMEGTMKKGFRK
jgi:hypothetical protein